MSESNGDPRKLPGMTVGGAPKVKEGVYHRTAPDGRKERYYVRVRDNEVRLLETDAQVRETFKGRERQTLDRAEHLDAAPKIDRVRPLGAAEHHVDHYKRTIREWLNDPNVRESQKRMRLTMARKDI